MNPGSKDLFWEAGLNPLFGFFSLMIYRQAKTCFIMHKLQN